MMIMTAPVNVLLEKIKIILLLKYIVKFV